MHCLDVSALIAPRDLADELPENLADEQNEPRNEVEGIPPENLDPARKHPVPTSEGEAYDAAVREPSRGHREVEASCSAVSHAVECLPDDEGSAAHLQA